MTDYVIIEYVYNLFYINVGGEPVWSGKQAKAIRLF